MTDSLSPVASPQVAIPLPWQQGIWQRLMDLQHQGRFPHALLLSGPAGVGAGHLAEALMARLLCQAPGEFACGYCHSCAMLAAGYHPNLMRVRPLEKSRQIRIDAIREVNDFVNQTAQQGGYRIITLEPADAMNQAAANALLKSLEEPGDHTLFLLMADIPSQILPTLRSRCQQWMLPTPKSEACLGWLGQQLGDPQEAEFWLQVAGGEPLLAKQLASPKARSLRQDMRELFDSLVRGGEPVAEAARLAGQSLDSILWYGITWLEDLIRLGLSGDTRRVRNPDLLPLYRQAVKNARIRDWFRLLDYAQEQRRLLSQGSNPNPPLVLEAWLIRWSALLRS